MILAVRRPRAWVVLGLAAALLVLGSVGFARRLSALEPDMGAEWVQGGRCPIAFQVDPEGVAGKAGLLDGDCLIAAGGTRIDSALEASEIAWDSMAGSSMALTVERDGIRQVIHVRPLWEPRGEPYNYLVLVGLAFWLSGVFIAVRWPKIRGGRIYSLLAACMFAQLVLSRTGYADFLDWLIDWADLAAIALTPALLVHAAVAMTRRAVSRRRYVLVPAYTLAGLLLLAAIWLSPATLGGAYRFNNPLGALERWDRIGHFMLGLSVLVTAALLIKSSNQSPSVMHRSQARWLLVGVVVGLGPFALLYAVPWALGAAELPTWAQFLVVLPMLLVPVTFTAALARYRLYDLDLFLLRGLSEVTTVFFTFAVYATAYFLIREGVSGLFPLTRSAARYASIIVAAVSYPQLREWVRSTVERAFYRKRYSYRATLLDWARELNAEIDLVPIVQRLRKRVRETLGLSEAEVLIRTGPWRFQSVGGDEEADPLELDEASLGLLDKSPFIPVERGQLGVVPWARYLFSVKAKGNLCAVMVIGQRERPEEPLTTEDRALLGTLAAHVGTAIEVARLVLELRKRAEEIERLHKRQERILESSAVGLLMLDGEGRILAWNRALEAIYGLPRDEAIGKSLGDVFPLHVARRIEREGSQGTEETRIFRLTLTNREGERVVVNIAISPADEGETGGDGSRVVTFDDVSQRVALEQQVLQQERLASLGLLAAGVAHEINTPLTGISGYTQLLLEDSGTREPDRITLEKIEAQTRRAAEITNSLLTLARPERTDFQELDLNQTISEALQLFEPQVRGRNVRLEASLEQGLAPVRGHRGKLQQVLLNLLLNARDAVGESGEIRVGTFRDNGKAVIEVTDDGAGIAEEDIPRIFDPFFSTKGRGKGTGLGLSITYGIIEEHDGSIRVDSIQGGTRFRVELPALQATRDLPQSAGSR